MIDKPVINTDLKKYDKAYVVEDDILWEVFGDGYSQAEVIWDKENICELLNEQQATINEYKENWDDMVELATKTSLRNVELDEQIGQLRKELNDCEKFRYTVFKRMGELNDE